MIERIQGLQAETDARLSRASFHPFRWPIDRVPLVGTGPQERGLTDLLSPYRNFAISQSSSLYSNVKWSNRKAELGFNACGSNKIWEACKSWPRLRGLWRSAFSIKTSANR